MQASRASAWAYLGGVGGAGGVGGVIQYIVGKVSKFDLLLLHDDAVFRGKLIGDGEWPEDEK